MLERISAIVTAQCFAPDDLDCVFTQLAHSRSRSAAELNQCVNNVNIRAFLIHFLLTPLYRLVWNNRT